MEKAKRRALRVHSRPATSWSLAGVFNHQELCRISTNLPPRLPDTHFDAHKLRRTLLRRWRNSAAPTNRPTRNNPPTSPPAMAPTLLPALLFLSTWGPSREVNGDPETSRECCAASPAPPSAPRSAVTSPDPDLPVLACSTGVDRPSAPPAGEVVLPEGLLAGGGLLGGGRWNRVDGGRGGLVGRFGGCGRVTVRNIEMLIL